MLLRHSLQPSLPKGCAPKTANVPPVSVFPVALAHNSPCPARGSQAACRKKALSRQQPNRVLCSAGSGGSNKSLYEVLGVSENASARDIKSAFRKKALKLHPDVNKAPNATESFMEAKMAFQTLSDESARADYDRKLRMGFGSSRDWNSFGGAAGGAGYKARPRQAQPQENYSFEDFMRDLDKEVTSWAKERSKAASTQDTPGSLFEELAMVGEEFVEFLEDSLGLTEDGGRDKARSSSGSSTSTKRDFGLDGNAVDAFDKLMEALDLDKEDGARRGGSSGSSKDSTTARDAQQQQQASAQQQQRQQQQRPPKQAEEDVDAMLAELKRKVGREK